MGAIPKNMWMQMIYGSSRTAVNNLIVAELQMYVCRAAIRRNMQMIYGSSRTQCQDESRSLSGSVPEILTACRMLQISIAWCQIDAEIRGFPTMYIMGG